MKIENKNLSGKCPNYADLEADLVRFYYEQFAKVLLLNIKLIPGDTQKFVVRKKVEFDYGEKPVRRIDYLLLVLNKLFPYLNAPLFIAQTVPYHLEKEVEITEYQRVDIVYVKSDTVDHEMSGEEITAVKTEMQRMRINFQIKGLLIKAGGNLDLLRSPEKEQYDSLVKQLESL